MIRDLAHTIALTLFGASAALGQQNYTNHTNRSGGSTSRFDLATGYNFIDANAPPGSCQCFTMIGGFVSGDFSPKQWLGFTGRVTAGHATHISSLGQNLTLTTFTAGPRVSWVHSRFTPFGEFLLGGAHGSGSYFPSGTSSSSSATSFAYSTGGGLDLNLTSRIAIRALDAEYLHTGFQNGVNNSQHQLKIGAGIVFRFGEGNQMVLPPKLRSTETLPTSPAQVLRSGN